MIAPRVLFSSLFLLASFSFSHAQNLTLPDAEISATEESIVDAAPVRMAYFSFVEGDVLWRIAPESIDAELVAEASPDESTQWEAATINLPLRVGMEIRVGENARAEICFDDGSLIRLGGDSHLVFETLEAEADSAFTALRLNGGLATLKVKHESSLFQLQSRSTSVRARGPATVRIDASTQDDALAQIAVRAGRALIDNSIGTLTLRAGQSLRTSPDDTEFNIGALSAADNWERWNLERDDFWAGDDAGKNLPENLSLVAGDLNRYGTWRDDAQHGRVWYPRVTASTWRPYSYGRWSWHFPFGWTWVSNEPWGWAPYHYGTWISTGSGWGWVPGPAMQPWCPAVVSFFWRDGNMCWAPLSPWEVRYPTLLPISRRNPRWSRCFSIGSTAVYYPTAHKYCEPRAWNSSYINYVTNVTYITYVTKVRKEKKIICKPPRRGGSTRVRLDGAPDEQFEKEFGRPLHEKQVRSTEDRSSFLPRHARRDGSTSRDGATTMSQAKVQQMTSALAAKREQVNAHRESKSNTHVQFPVEPRATSRNTTPLSNPDSHEKKAKDENGIKVREQPLREKTPHEQLVREQAAYEQAASEHAKRELQKQVGQQKVTRVKEERRQEDTQREAQQRLQQIIQQQAKEQQLRDQRVQEQKIQEQRIQEQRAQEQRARLQSIEELRAKQQEYRQQQAQQRDSNERRNKSSSRATPSHNKTPSRNRKRGDD